MAVIPLGHGKGVTWEPTTELICTKCREAFDPEQSLQTVFLMADYRSRIGEIRIKNYWYLHEACRGIEKTLKEMGANIQWAAYDMPFILGFFIEKDGYRSPHGKHEDREKRFPAGVYATMVEQWRSALGGLDTNVTETVDITTISIESPKTNVIILPTSTPPIEQKPGWLALRFTILQRDTYRCRVCGVKADDAPDVRLEVDHIIPRAHGGTDDPGNLWTLCFECNRGKGIQAI
jgi:hypothetical protein